MKTVLDFGAYLRPFAGGVLIALTGVLFGSAALAATVYNVNLSQSCTTGCIGDITVTGFIEMDSLGTGLDGSNVSDWELEFSSTNYPATVLNSTNGEILDIGTYSLTATAAELTFDMPDASSSESGIFAFRDSLSFPYIVLFQFQGGDGDDPELIFSNAPRAVFREPFDQAYEYINAQGFLLGTAKEPAPVPLPAALPLLACGLGGLGLLARRRRKTD